jgi:hypothetical protein
MALDWVPGAVPSIEDFGQTERGELKKLIAEAAHIRTE